MYAETFNVRPWLETPAKWLRWAMQSLTARNLTDVRYNLQQFWSALPQAKAQAKTQQDWSEILTLDAQSQWTLGNLYQAQASDVLKDLNKYTSARDIGGYLSYMDPMTAISKLANIQDPTITAVKAKLEDLAKKAQTAFDAQVNLASQAVAAANAAGIKSQAQATATVGAKYQAGASVDAAFMRQQADQMNSHGWGNDLLDAVKTPIIGIPLWAWLAGGAAVLLLLTTVPAMAQAAAIRRAVED